MNLANAYSDNIIGDRACNIEKAIHLYRQALEITNRNTAPLEWSKTAMNLANAYSKRIQGDRADNIEESIRCYEKSLEIVTRDDMPFEYANAITGLAISYYSRIRGDRTKNIETAIHFCEQALKVRNRDIMPSYNRITQRNLGNLCLEECRWAEACKAFAGLLSAHEILYKTAILPESRLSELREIRGIAAQMVYALIKSTTSENMSDVIKEAVTVLERNRAIWLSEALALKRGKPQAVPEEIWNDFDKRRKEYNELLIESRIPEDTPGRRSFPELGAVGRLARTYSQTDNMEYLERVIELSERALREADRSLPDYPIILNMLAVGLRDRYSREGRLEDLWRAIELFEQAIKNTPSDSPHMSMYFNKGSQRK